MRQRRTKCYKSRTNRKYYKAYFVISHYCHSQTDSKFLNPDLNLRKMYSLYQEKTDNPVSLSKYKNIFYSEFKVPHKDTCRMCNIYTAELSSADN